MTKARFFQTSFWTDSYIENLNKNEKLLFIYFITNPSTNLCGAYEVSIKRMSFDTGLEEKVILDILSKFEKDIRIKYEKGWVLIKNYQKNQSTHPNTQKGIEREMSELPEIVKKPYEVFMRLKTPSDPVIPVNSSSQPNLTKLNLTKPNSNRELRNSVTKENYTQQDLDLSNLLLSLIKQNNPKFKEPNIHNWANDIRLMREQDKRKPGEIQMMIQFAQTDDFWKTNILSTGKLRKQFDQLFAKAKQKITNNIIPKV